MKARSYSLLFLLVQNQMAMPAHHQSRLSKYLLDKWMVQRKRGLSLPFNLYVLGLFPVSITCLLGAFGFIYCQLVVML